MSDSVDRVFVHALATVRRLPRTGSSRPPPSARLRLYGLYKQSMEGDVSAILPRPSLPVSSPNPNDPNNTAIHRYASRDLRTRETQAEIEKWDAWNACDGMSRTEAKRKYITILIETMKEYASGTAESRELVSELEFVWNQIKSQSGSEESEGGESPTRKLERAGLKRTDTNPGESPDRRRSGSHSEQRAARAAAAGSSMFGFARMDTGGSNFSGGRRQSQAQSASQESQTKTRSKRRTTATTSNGLRILSPMSQGSSDDIVENEEMQQLEHEPEPDSPSSAPDENPDQEEDNDDDGQESSRHGYQPIIPADVTGSNDPWRKQIEAHMSRLTLELTALREQLSSHSLLSRSTFSHPIDISLLPFRKRLFYQATGWIRWALDIIIRQFVIQVGLLSVILLYGRWKGDRRVENWVKARLKELRTWLAEGGLWDWRLRKWLGYTRISI